MTTNKYPEAQRIAEEREFERMLEQLEKFARCHGRAPGERLSYRYELIDKIRPGEDFHASQLAFATAI